MIGTGEMHHECWAQVCAPFYKGDMHILHQVHRRALEVIWCVKHLSYKESLKDLGLVSLEKKKLGGIKVYKYCFEGVKKTEPDSKM